MSVLKIAKTITMLLGFVVLNACKGTSSSEIEVNSIAYSYQIPPAGNSWVVSNHKQASVRIDQQGIQQWTDPSTKINTYVYLNDTGALQVGLNARVNQGSSTILVTINGQTKEVVIDNVEFKEVHVGSFNIDKPGYHPIEIQGVEKSGDAFAIIKTIAVGGLATTEGVTYVKDDFYWGQRGPSVHLTYQTPQDKDILWFYNEITVAPGQDVIGSYFMANGFGEGYFGIQVNSEKERRVLFSVWSPYQTQNPEEIPEGYKIIMLGKGQGVHTGEFGNEGSGGQSYKVFNWKAGITYKFLLKGEPSVNNSTDYTAYFFDPEEDQWNLIASFRRPYTSTYLTRPHSFLENFVTKTGYISRQGSYGNQWVYDTNGQWHELTKATFTADATARKGARLDYAAGVDSHTFYMKNCGFFSEHTPIDSEFERTPNGKSPSVDFSKLEVPTIK